MSNETRNAKSVRPTDLDFCLKQFHDTKLKAHAIRRTAEDDLLNAIVLEIKALKNRGVPATDIPTLDAMMAEVDKRVAEIKASDQKPFEAVIDDDADCYNPETGQVKPPKKRGRPAKTTTGPAENTVGVSNG